MKHKELIIMEAANKLFAEKGFRAASIQDIASASGISKGAFYLHFQSKEALLLSILKYHHSQFDERASAIEQKNLPPRETFLQWVSLTFEEISKHREFIITHLREQTVPFNKEIENFFRQKEWEGYLLYEKNLIRIYGEGIRPFLGDLIILAKGMLRSYLELIIFDVVSFDRNHLPAFLLERMDHLVEGFKGSRLEPIISEQSMKQMWKSVRTAKIGSVEHMIEELQETRKLAHDDEDILITLDVLEEELQSSQLRKPVVKGMLANLEKDESFREFADLLRTYIL
ncbi:TetR/AcrR family transcriptional regulator [Bacillus sp. FJAT-42376]|uniref:TetR/AcrR family transcriptional regulator n=1 Tax=Bacillus sp. FJAT-42376 TaxID=2014076 RepID=UPI000F4FB79C|nr:TetR/AcrR family transcriptional regulator [Bacillus sp. FJAT-42376]AZB40988.1 TetR/AcrR family transcriptional regulator [Bacillus sp. FJAT-42376]